jgi:hypothetical protein
MDNRGLEAELRRKAFQEDCELVIERVDDRWRAAICRSVEADDRRGALEALRLVLEPQPGTQSRIGRQLADPDG